MKKILVAIVALVVLCWCCGDVSARCFRPLRNAAERIQERRAERGGFATVVKSSFQFRSFTPAASGCASGNCPLPIPAIPKVIPKEMPKK